MSRRWLVASVVALLSVTTGVVGAVVLRDPTGDADHPVVAAGVDRRSEVGVASSAPAASASSSTAIGTAAATPSTPVPVPVPTTSTPAAVAGVGSLVGRVKPGVIRDGVATFYSSDGGGACLYDPSPDPLTAAMNWADYEDSKACGAYVLVQAPNGASVTVRITNLCPQPCRVGQLDLSAEAFALLAEPRLGEIPITWKLVSPGVSGGISLRYKAGSSQYWCGIQMINHRNPVARLEVRTSAGWKQLSRTDYNYFLSEDGSGCGGAVAVTDIYGQRLVIDPLPVRPDVVQGTSLQFDRH